MELEAVGDLALHIILLKLGPEDTLKVSSVSKRLRDSASDDLLWSKFCLDDLDLESPQDPHGNPAPSFKVAYQLWREAFAMYPWPLVLRVKRCWDRIKSWLRKNFPEAEATIRGGASESEIEQFENLLKVKLPLPTRVLYRFHDGQELAAKTLAGNSHLLLGIMGGYSFYNRLVNVYLLPLSEVIVKTREVVHHLGFLKYKFIVVAASSTASEKLFFLSCRYGGLTVGTRNILTSGEMIQCVPDSLIRCVHDSSGDQQQDAMLLWLEEHGRRLESGIINVREQENIRSISLFPEVPPLCSVAVTNGVQVRGSAVLVPEFVNLQDDFLKRYLFAYSIRMSLQPEGCIINGMTFNSCQLYSRHWLFRSNGDVIANVDGEAVIGKYPLLRSGEGEFVYESYTLLPSSSVSGSAEGYFTFVPGRLADQKGGPFEVQVARFPIEMQDYIY